jgi:hypothetical protein
VDGLNDIRPGEDEVIVATLERFTTEILSAQVVALDVRAHCAIVHDYAAVNGLQVRRSGACFAHLRPDAPGCRGGANKKAHA